MDTNAPASIDKMKALAGEQSTDVLLASLTVLEAIAKPEPAERLTKAVISDVIEERHGLSDAMDAIYGADDFAGTYTDALIIALASVTA